MATTITLKNRPQTATVSATNANADIVLSAPTNGHIEASNIAFGFSATPAAATFQILVGAVVKYEVPYMATSTEPVVIPGPLICSTGAEATLRLTAGGAGIIGYVSCTASIVH